MESKRSRAFLVSVISRKFAGDEMRLRRIADGRLLDKRRFSPGTDKHDPDRDVSRLGHTEHSGHMRLLHE